MAGHARFTAVLDACVLFPIATADALLSLAAADLYAAKWTTAIDAERIAAGEPLRPELTGKFLVRRDAMHEAIPDREVDEAGWQALAPSLALPDSNDNHVLAAAIAGHADCIETANLKDFPDKILSHFGVWALHPDDFIIARLDLDLFSALAALKEMRARKKNPPLTAFEFADSMARNGLVGTAARLRVAAALI